jgi:hypothetical protein
MPFSELGKINLHSLEKSELEYANGKVGIPTFVVRTWEDTEKSRHSIYAKSPIIPVFLSSLKFT